LFHAAGTIYAASQNGKGDRYLQAAAALNPNLKNFHVHR
jgi:hypothetical protein